MPIYFFRSTIPDLDLVQDPTLDSEDPVVDPEDPALDPEDPVLDPVQERMQSDSSLFLTLDYFPLFFRVRL